MRARHTLTTTLLLCATLSTSGCGLDDPATDRVLLFAAASTAGPMGALIDTWNDRNDVQLQASYASSSMLAQQIDLGAPADLFVSANTTWVDHLDERGALIRESRVELMRGQLVLIEPKTSPKTDFGGWESLDERLENGRLATGDSAHVPLGIYTQEALTTLGVWANIAPRVTNAHNARVALAQVERGEARLGIVYATDAKASERVRVVATLPEGSHSPVTYTVSMTSNADPEHARDVLEHLTDVSARETYAKHHFQSVP